MPQHTILVQKTDESPEENYFWMNEVDYPVDHMSILYFKTDDKEKIADFLVRNKERFEDEDGPAFDLIREAETGDDLLDAIESSQLSNDAIVQLISFKTTAVPEPKSKYHLTLSYDENGHNEVIVEKDEEEYEMEDEDGAQKLTGTYHRKINPKMVFKV